MDNFSESFNRTKLLINYDVSKTLSENEVREQIIIPPDLSFNLFNWMKTWDVHDWFTLVQLVLMFLGFFTMGTTSIISLALGTIVGVAEAAVFLVKDKDPYMATVMMILSIFGVDDLMKIPIVKRYGIEGTKQLIRRSKSGAELTAQEIKDLKALGKYIKDNLGEILPKFKFAIKKQVMKYISKKGAKWVMNFIYTLDKGKTMIFVAGTWIPFDYWYIYTFKDDIEKMSLRDNNSFFQIVKWVESKISSGKVQSDEQSEAEQILMDNYSFDGMVDDFPKFDTTKINSSPKKEIIQRNNIIQK
jgi:hypothetical protein